jgi:hypothetical protein
MKTSQARAQMGEIQSRLDELATIEVPTDRDWSRLVETYAQFIDRMDEWDEDPPKMETMTDEELEALAENLVTRMHS